MTGKAQVRCKVIETTLQYQTRLSVVGNLPWFLAKNRSKSLSFHRLGSNLMTSLCVVFTCIVMIFFHKLTLILSYSMPKIVKIECHLHGSKNRSTFQNLENPYRSIVLANI